MRIFDVHWTSYDQKNHYIIGKLTHNNNWTFVYNQDVIKEAIAMGFRPFFEMPNIHAKYVCATLFPVFQMRYLLNKSKPIIYAMEEQTGELVTDKILIKQVPLKRKRNYE